MASAARVGISGSDAAPRYLEEAEPLPFEHILVPFVGAARAELAREAGHALQVFSPAAQTTLERALLQHIARFALPTLDQEFALRRSIDGRFPWQAEPRSTVAYERFVAEMLGGGIAGVLREYPILERVIASWSSGWARSYGRLARRLARDWRVLAKRFAIGGECRVVAIAPCRSDPHHGGETVSILEFAGGRLLVYKPRSLAMEDGFTKLLAQVNERGFPAPLRVVDLLQRGDYGWMEFVDAAPCETSAEVGEFYVRAGGLLCLLSVLQATDIHHENLIAAGAQPVIVDLETLFHPRTGDAGFASLLTATGFLPEDDHLDFSALGATGSVATPFRFAQCEDVNSDAMTVTQALYRVPRRDNVPMLRGRPQRAAEHVESITAGFAAMFLLAIRNRGELLALLRRFAGRPARVIVRSSNTYGLLLQESLQPPYMRDAGLRAALFARLHPIREQEIDALDQLNVPYLAGTCDEALAQVIARVERAAESDLPSHLAILRGELAGLEGVTNG